MMAVVVAITNRKGGTGKTTTTVNLSAELAYRGKKTLVVDLDTQAHSTIGLGFTLSRNTPTVHSLLVDDEADLHRVVINTRWENLYLCPANPLFEHHKVLSNKRLREVLKKGGALEEFDFILIDTPPSLDSILLNALVAADYVLIPFLPHFLSAEGIRSFIRVFLRVVSQENPSLKLLGLVPVMVNERIQHHKRTTESMSQQVGAGRIFSGIRTDIKLVEAFEHRQPIRYYSPSSRGAKDFSKLADEVLSVIRSRSLSY